MFQDLRLALRRLLAAPAFTIAAVLTLAIGIGSTAALGGIVYSVLVRALPIPDADQVIAVRATNLKEGKTSGMSARDVEDWSRSSRTIAAFGAWRDWSFSRTTSAGRERFYGIIASPGLFDVLGVKPLTGRLFTEAENRPGQGNVLLLTESAWRGRFGADPSIAGRQVTLSRAPRPPQPYTIIGVLPDVRLPSFQDVTFFAPASVDEDAFEGRWLRNRVVWARIAAGQSLRDARAELETMAAQLAAAHSDSHAGWSVDVRPLAHAEIGATRGALLFFSAAITFVLLVACANVAGLLMVRASGREREFAVRSALGAGSRHLLRIVLAEAVVLGAAAAVASALVRLWLLDVIVSLGPSIPRMDAVSPVVAVVLTLALTMVAVLLFGALPARQASRSGVAALSSRAGGRAVSAGGVRARGALVAVQVAIALMLLSGAGVAIRTLSRVLAPPAGFDASGLVVTQLFPSTARYATRPAVGQLTERLLADLRGLPGVESVSTVSAGPLFGGNETTEVRTAEAAVAADGKYPTARFFDASPGYFRTMGATLIEGRDLSDSDRTGAPAVAVVNQAFAARFWPGQSALGRSITLPREERELQVVGVVSNFAKSLQGDPAEPEVYWAFQQKPRWAFYLVARASGTADTASGSLRQRIAAIDPELAPARIVSLDTLRERATRGERFSALVLGVFAASALLLAAIGTDGLVSYSARQRTREIGIRISFGAAPRDIWRLVLGTGMLPIGAGIGAGIMGAVAAGRGAAALIPGIAASDGWAALAASAAIALTAVAACVVPARRATRIDPIVALSAE